MLSVDFQANHQELSIHKALNISKWIAPVQSNLVRGNGFFLREP